MLKVRRFFPGGNTCLGFFNSFDGIFPPWDRSERVYILKGGPGVGKNTLMGQLAQNAQDKGFNVEYFHCASDEESLDAVRIPQKGITMLDGTAPHVIDPVLPGAADGIVNLGIFLDEKRLAERRAEIEKLFLKNKLCYVKAFAFLEAAGSIKKSACDIYSNLIDKQAVRRFVSEIINTDRNRHFAERRLFSSAYTPTGFVDFTDDAVYANRIIRIKEGFGRDSFMETVLDIAKFNGARCEVYRDPLLPDRIQHIMDLDSDVAFITCKNGADTDIDEFCDKSGVNYNSGYFELAEGQINTLTENAIKYLSETKSVHDEIERIYTPSMDFDSQDRFKAKFLDGII